MLKYLKSLTLRVFLLVNIVSAQEFRETIIIPSDGKDWDLFGNSVSISGNYAAVGAPWDDDKGIESGSVYIYKKENGQWNFRQKLHATDLSEDNRFGKLIMQNERLIISGFNNINAKIKTGAVYEFKLVDDKWIEKRKIPPPDTIEGAMFGAKVLLCKNFAIVGSMRNAEYGQLTGAVYVYLIKDDGWQLLKKLTTDNPDEDDTFGLSLSMNDKYLAVGAPQDSNKNGIYAGALYLYKKTSDTTWEKDTVLIAPTGYWFDGYGKFFSN